jgi:hypothetical protein
VVIGANHLNHLRKDALGHAGDVEDMFNVVECGFQEVCNFSAPGDTTIVGGILSHPVVGEFKWKAIGNGDRIFEGCSVQNQIRDMKKHLERR